MNNCYLKHKEYYKPGGRGYENMAQKITCECGWTTRRDKHKVHLKSKIHEKRMKVLEPFE